MARDTAKGAVDTMEPEADAKPDVSVRKCMMCKTEFPSGWSGERICRKCKSTDKWRSA